MSPVRPPAARSPCQTLPRSLILELVRSLRRYVQQRMAWSRAELSINRRGQRQPLCRRRTNRRGSASPRSAPSSVDQVLTGAGHRSQTNCRSRRLSCPALAESRLLLEDKHRMKPSKHSDRKMCRKFRVGRTLRRIRSRMPSRPYRMARRLPHLPHCKRLGSLLRKDGTFQVAMILTLSIPINKASNSDSSYHIPFRHCLRLSSLTDSSTVKHGAAVCRTQPFRRLSGP